MKIQEILRRKGSHVFTVRSRDTLDRAVELLVGDNVGSLLVCESDSATQTLPDGPVNEQSIPRLVGIITERDIMRVVATHRGSLDKLCVADVMTTELVTVSPSDTTRQTMGLMTEHRIRHLPVLADNELCGMISIGDVVKVHYEIMEQENYFLKSYIQGGGAACGTPEQPR